MRTPVAFALLGTGIIAQIPQPRIIEPHLERRLSETSPGELVPIYAVMRDRLGHDDWFPRINLLFVDERRALVTGELRAHAERTQSRLRALLARAESAGEARSVTVNWLGNFVAAEATGAVITAIAALAEVEEVRLEGRWPLAEVEDGGAEPGTVTAAPAGRGPLNTGSVHVWPLGFKGQGVLVMNADSGINLNHGDLQQRLWRNPGEVPNNGIDDDRNGFIDDYHGWNFLANNHDLGDGGGHGTLTASAVAGDGTCSGIVMGEAPEATILTARLGVCCPQTGPVSPAGEVAEWQAIQYALQMGVHVQTSSHSYKNGFVPPPNYRMHREVADNSLAAGLIRFNSSSNNGAVRNDPTSPDRIPFNISAPANGPAPYLAPNQTLIGQKSGVIGVGAHDSTSNLLVDYTPSGPFAWLFADLLTVNPTFPATSWKSPEFDDYPWLGGQALGLIKPDITGPTNCEVAGTGTCGRRNGTGTSTATPHVAGCAVLWKGANPSLLPEDVAMIVHQSAVPSGSGAGKENRFGAGRVDSLAGLHLALCVHRVDGDPAWSVEHRAGTTLTLDLDTRPDRPFLLVAGTQRTQTSTGGGVIGVGGSVAILVAGRSDGAGDVRVSVPIPASLAGLAVLTQFFADDRGGPTGIVLSSNVVETRFVR